MALLRPAGTVTVEGTESNGLLLAIDTTESEVVAEPRLTVQLADTLLVIAEGEHDSDVGPRLAAIWALSVIVWETPLRVAMSRAA
jgi:hypothetical protein